MIKILIRISLLLSVAITIVFAAQAVRFNIVDGDAQVQYNNMINNKIESVGFVLSDVHERIDDGYKKRFGTKVLKDGKPNSSYDLDWKETLDNLGFFSVSYDVALRELLISNPQLGGFSPFNLHIYKKKNENKTYVGHLVPEVMLDVVGVEDEATREKFAAMFPVLDEMVQKEIGGKVEITEYSALPKKPMMNFEITFDRPEDLGNYIDEFQDKFEATFEKKKYIIAGYKNFKESYTELKLEFGKYDAYFVYSLCHFTYSYNIFNKSRPDAGVFAPCSMYMYIEQGSNKLVIGMPKLANWTAVLNIKDKIMNKSAEDLDKEITKIMISLGAKEVY